MAKRGNSPTLAADVAEQLREDILSGQVSPGQRLPLKDLSSRYGVSNGVVREVLIGLVKQNLVQLEPNRGFRVPELVAEELNDLTETRTIVELKALGLAIDRGDVDWETKVVAAHHRLAKTPALPTTSGHQSREWSTAHHEFHMALLLGCANESLLDICRRLQDAAELYRAWARAKSVARDRATEHAGILHAALARDKDRALSLYRHHLENTKSQLFDEAQG